MGKAFKTVTNINKSIPVITGIDSDKIKSNHLIKVTSTLTTSDEQKIFNTGDILYGKVNIPSEFVMYTGGETESAVVYVDNNTRKITATARGFSIEDVRVDNTSVVENKIAYIELEPIRNLITAEKERAIDRENEIDDARVHDVNFSNIQGTEKLKITLKDKNSVLIATDDIDLGEIVSGIIKVELKTDENGFYLLFTKGNGTEIKCYLNPLVSDYDSKVLAEQTRATAQENILTNSIQTEAMRAKAKEAYLEVAISQAGKVDDVKVDGESVVINKVANINLQSIKDSINIEAETRSAADTTLQTSINTEVIRATTAESTIGSAIAEVGNTVPLISIGEKEYKFYIRLQNGKPQLVYEEI